MSALKVLEFDPKDKRSYLIACERTRLSNKKISADEMSRLVIATKGERLNFDLIGRVLAERLRLKEQR